jgi:hypothetical protein
LYAIEIVWPDADTELVEPQLFIGGRLDGRLDHAAAGVAAPRLINEISGEMAAQEDILEALATIRRGLPALRELTRAMPHHDRVSARIHRDLIKGVDVVAVIGLPCWLERFARVECSWCGRNRAADREAALFPDDQRFSFARLLRDGARGRQQADRQQ